jgi:lysozyme family protein
MILGGSICTIKTEALLVTSNKTVLEINAENTKYIAIARDQNVGLLNVGTLHTFQNSPNTSESHV